MKQKLCLSVFNARFGTCSGSDHPVADKQGYGIITLFVVNTLVSLVSLPGFGIFDCLRVS